MSPDTLLAVPITRPDPPLAAQVRAACAAGANLIELRLDYLADEPAVAELLSQPHPVPFILTIRDRSEGGGWDGNETRRAALFERLGRLAPGYIDVEYAAWARSADLRQKLGAVCSGAPRAERAGRERAGQRPPNALILSHHDLAGTPTDLETRVAPLLASPAAVVKVACTARDATDAWRVLVWLGRHAATRPIAGLAMGAPGLLTRVLARKFGGFFAFAALEPGAESAPGQPTLAELLHLYRWRSVGPHTRVYGILGWPASHSRGPQVHNAAMEARRIDGVYVPMPVAPTAHDFAAFMDYLTSYPGLDVYGLSVTRPHKEHALGWLTERGHPITDLARQVGAVNTLSRLPGGGWIGDNTDVAGVLAALGGPPPGSVDLRGQTVAVLGAGGAARAAVAALSGAGCRVTVFNRTAMRARKLADELHCRWQPWDERASAQPDILVNCTSIGTYPDVNASPLPGHVLRPGTLVFDMVYAPVETLLLQDARRAGCRVVDGLAMFIGQAARQFAGWHECDAPTDVMSAALQGT